MRYLLLISSAVASLSCAARGTDAGGERVVASLDEARAMADAVGPATLFERVSHPDPYLTDFFGVQVLAPLSRRDVLRALVPAHARLLEDRGHALRLQMLDGPAVEFHFDTELEIAGNVMAEPFARIDVADAERYPEQPARFRELLRRAGLADRFLLTNPHHAEEQLAATRMRAPESVTPVSLAADTTGFGGEAHAAIIVGETHGPTGPYDQVMALLRSPSVDWVGIEMLPVAMQPELDVFLDAAADRNAYDSARAALLEYYAGNWNTRGHEVTDEPALNPYFRLLEAARAERKRVYALDATPLYIVFRFGEFPLGAATRDVVWAGAVPAAGRGVIYGGSSHFAAGRRPNMLTFLRERYPDVALYRAPTP